MDRAKVRNRFRLTGPDVLPTKGYGNGRGRWIGTKKQGQSDRARCTGADIQGQRDRDKEEGDG